MNIKDINIIIDKYSILLAESTKNTVLLSALTEELMTEIEDLKKQIEELTKQKQ